MSLFALDADRLAATLASSLEMAFRAAVSGTPSDAQAGVRLAKYTLNTLMQLFNFATVAECVSEPTLRALVGVTLNVLPDPRLQHVDDGPALVRALNLLVIRVISNCAKAPTIAIFLDMLLSPPVLPSSPQVTFLIFFQPQGDVSYPLPPFLFHSITPPSPSPFPPDCPEHLPASLMLQGTEEEIVKLVVKCMVKITKALGQLLPVLDIGAVLLSIHSFFVTLGNAEIKR